MTLIDSNSIGLGPAAAQNLSGTEPTTKTSGSVDDQKLQKAAGEFESILLASMWKSMKQSFGTTDGESDPAHGTLDDWGIEVMSGAVGKAGGLGIGRLILKHLEPTLKEHPATPVSGTSPSSSPSPIKQGT
jgi:Rod binding domain-containing protein